MDPAIAAAHVDSTTERYRQLVRIGRHELVADEPAALGGADAGPPPYGLLAAALAACTSITLRMYADRKGWELGPVGVDVVVHGGRDEQHLERTIRLSPSVTAEQRARLAEIADKTPLTRTLSRATPIRTTLA
jgi:putative redox protein